MLPFPCFQHWLHLDRLSLRPRRSPTFPTEGRLEAVHRSRSLAVRGEIRFHSSTLIVHVRYIFPQPLRPAPGDEKAHCFFPHAVLG